MPTASATAHMGSSGVLDASQRRRQLVRAVFASSIGTTIEWYDFFLYSIVTGLVFAKLFFPNSDPLVGTLEAFSIYAVGFIARPIGPISTTTANSPIVPCRNNRGSRHR